MICSEFTLDFIASTFAGVIVGMIIMTFVTVVTLVSYYVITRQ